MRTRMPKPVSESESRPCCLRRRFNLKLCDSEPEGRGLTLGGTADRAAAATLCDSHGAVLQTHVISTVRSLEARRTRAGRADERAERPGEAEHTGRHADGDDGDGGPEPRPRLGVTVSVRSVGARPRCVRSRGVGAHAEPEP
eukprot:2875018-Rhodomonas_salina.1